MKRTLKKILEWKLRFLSRKVLKKYQPVIIGITGSVGKTSTKEAIYTVLKDHFRVGQNIKNYNNEIGVPLSIIGEESGGKSPLAWLKVFLVGLDLLLGYEKDYPEILVLEMAADRPGDIKYLTDFVSCDIGVVTAIGPVHLEFFKTIENIMREKKIIVSHLKSDGFAVLNVDDKLVYPFSEKTRAQILTFGFSEEAQVQGSEVAVSKNPKEEGIDQMIKGLSFKLSYKGSVVPVFLPGVLGNYQAYSALAAAACGVARGLNLVDISKSLKKFRSPRGRMNLIKGIKHTLIIDDTYNASPMAAQAALSVLTQIPLEGRKFAVLGDMLELGEYSIEGHREVGRKCAQTVDVLIAVGEKARDIARGALRAGMSRDKVFSFGDIKRAGIFVQNRIKKGDLVLVKGSQGARMEKAVKELMAEPLRAKEFLVRQDETWQN